MSNKRITDMYIKQIIALKDKGKSQRQISKELGLHRRTISYYLDQYDRVGRPNLENTEGE